MAGFFTAKRLRPVLFSLSFVLPQPVFAMCGDGVIDPGEQCDDGNAESRGWCSADCHAIQGPPQRLYIAASDGAVHVIDLATDTTVAQIPVGNPDVLKASANGRFVGTLSTSAATELVIIDTWTNTIAHRIVVDGYPDRFSLAFSPDGSRAYVHDGNTLLYQINVSTETVERSFDTYLECDNRINPASGMTVAISHDGSKAFLVTHFDAQLEVLDLESGKIECHLFGDPDLLQHEYPSSDHPTNFVLSRDDRRVFAAFDWSYTYLSALDVRKDSAIVLFEQYQNSSTVQLSCDGRRLYANAMNDFLTIDPDTMSIISRRYVPPISLSAYLSALTKDGGTFLWGNYYGYAPYWMDTSSYVTHAFSVQGTGIALVTNPGHSSACSYMPREDCVTGFSSASLSVNESAPGRESLRAIFRGGPATTGSQLGDPFFPPCGTTSYTLCLYDADHNLEGEMLVDRAGSRCSGDRKMCWQQTAAGSGIFYQDFDAIADGVEKLKLRSGSAGKTHILLKAANDSTRGWTHLPTGIAAGLALSTAPAPVIMQLITSDAACFSASLTTVKRADSQVFKAYE